MKVLGENMKIIMLGPQGSGKGTHAKFLAEGLNVPHLSTGEILRKTPRDSPLGKQVFELIDKGVLVPDELIAKIVNERLKSAEFSKGFILDGFPRNIHQAKMLEVAPDHVLYLDISDKEAMKRLSGRWQCRKCEAIYGPDAPPKKKGICDKCGGELYQRDDDKPEAIAKRLRIFHTETEPLKDFYKEQGLLRVVKGQKEIDDTFKAILKVLKLE